MTVSCQPNTKLVESVLYFLSKLLDGVFPEETNPEQPAAIIRKDGSTEVVPCK